MTGDGISGNHPAERSFSFGRREREDIPMLAAWLRAASTQQSTLRLDIDMGLQAWSLNILLSQQTCKGFPADVEPASVIPPFGL